MSFRKVLSILFLLVLTATYCNAELPAPTAAEKNRAKILGYMIGKQLSKKHYSHKDINDSLSLEAFNIYLTQLDPQKRFFLQKDVDYLSQFKFELDNQLRSGAIDFPLIAENLLQERVESVQKMVEKIFKAGFDLEHNDDIETDEKKLAYCTSETELSERWRISLKYQLISRYLNMLEDEQGKSVMTRAVDGEKTSENAERAVKTKEEIFADAKEKLQKSSHELFKRVLRNTPRDAYDRYFSIIARAFDPHSDFMPPTTKEDFDIHMRGSLEGIGAVLQEDDGYIKVSRIIPGGAADRQKELQAEDIILMVAQGAAEPVDIVDMRIRDAVELIRGDKGSEVWLTVKKPDGVVTHIKIIRDVVQLEETFAKSAVMPETDGKGVYGYMKIPSFYRDFENTRDGGDGRNVTDDVRQELKDLEAKNIKGLILDLRNNGGGALVDAVKIAGLFIKYGPVVQVKTSGEEPEVLYDNDPEIQYDGPLVVLVNKFSASASEILAGALQDYNRAVVVGADHSYGKGTVQTLLNLDDYMPFMGFNLSQYKPMGALKMTTQKFYRISGESTQHKGVVPDIILPDRFKFVEAGEQYLENSLEWDRIDPVSFTPWHNLPDAANLKSLSEKRVSTDDDFKEIVKEAEEAKKRQEETIVHVNIDYLKSEMERLKELMKGNAHSEMGGQGELGQKGKDSDKELSKEEEGKMFIEQLREDPYVVESLHLLSDIAS